MFLPYGLWQCCHQQTLLCLVVVGTPFQLQSLNKSCPCLHMIGFPAYPARASVNTWLAAPREEGLRLICAPNVTRAYSKQSAPHENSAVWVAEFIINAHTYGVMLLLSCIDQYKESYPRIYFLFLLVGHLVVYWHVATNTMSCNVDSSSNAYYIYNTSVIKV